MAEKFYPAPRILYAGAGQPATENRHHQCIKISTPHYAIITMLFFNRFCDFSCPEFQRLMVASVFAYLFGRCFNNDKIEKKLLLILKQLVSPFLII